METLISYAYYETDKTKFNLEFYSNIGIINDKRHLYIIVINGENCSIKLPSHDNVIVLKRPNIGFDFGAHNHAINWAVEKYGAELPFKYYIFMNCGVIGPFIPPSYPKNLHWSTIFTSKITDDIKLVGTTISCLGRTHGEFIGPKVGGYFFTTDNIGLTLMLDKKDIFKDHDTKKDAIGAEYKMTDVIMNAGYGIDCMLYKYQGIDWKNKFYWRHYEGIFPDRQGTYFGISIHPFEVIFHKWYWAHHPNNLVNFDYCTKYGQWKLTDSIIHNNILHLNENPFYACVLCNRENNKELPDINKIYKITNNSTGLCNQLFGLVNSIIKCANIKRKYIIIDCFLACNEKFNILPISKVIDLQRTNANLNIFPALKELILIDRMNVDLNVRKAEYGFGNKVINVTEKLNTLLKYSKFIENINMNNLFGGDPFPGNKKILYINYEIDGNNIKDYINENDTMYMNLNYLTEHIFTNATSDVGWYASYEETFINLINLLVFKKEFYDIVNIISNKNKLNKLSFIHFRIENDAIKHWSNQNKLSTDLFEQKLHNKYKNLLERYINKDEIVYILSDNEKKVIDLFGSDYKFMYTSREEKDELLIKHIGSTGRELRAIIDLLLGIKYSSLFIGCHSYKYKRGSSFSYIVSKLVHCKKVLIDLDCIDNEEEVYE
ncbi:GDP-fucose protein O-fucosyltransferase [Fadolivirus algeromassiliense]|jgi:hypothetical protein|uniref:GDP-fucose protein O-fucosyltransferase n=1 Tax=Fadolivirus FV1/VV64 TaxID=3070911 RepID=A0A7D3UQL8_9VIRU|nr:GDP-fucose protein O-fucosyltransferase [Fadolivirus algeromassiliense]QKF94528.1 GDP-fucose protein O-fucosyltransferase [Fadolivirus FV1/VV64]